MKPDPLEQFIGIKLTVFVAGLIGAVVQLYYHTGLTVTGAIASVLAGVGCAAFVTPALHWMWAVPPQVEYGTAFFMGLLGMGITGKVYLWFQSVDPQGFIRGVLGFLNRPKNGKDE